MRIELMNNIKLYLRKNINVCFLTLLLMSMANLLFMHYQFLFTIGLESQPFIPRGPIANLMACLFDVTFVLSVTWILSCLRVRPALAFTFIITLVWSFVNIFYSRFFYHYISLSAIDQAENLTDSTVVSSVLDGFNIIDLYYPLIALLFYFIYIKSKTKDVKTGSFRTMVCLWICSIFMVLSVNLFYAIYHKNSLNEELEKTVLIPHFEDLFRPNRTIFHEGSIRQLLQQFVNDGDILELSDVQKTEIDNELKDYRLRPVRRMASDNVKNVVFILVESYLSSLIDMTVEGKEITPCLNQLKKDNTVYYNGCMQPNASIGRSSDGQLIYMAGLLPLYSEITVNRAKNISLIGLPKVIKDVYPEMYSYTIIPNTPTLWEQQHMSSIYGFDRLFTVLDYKEEMNHDIEGNCLDDEMVLKYASFKDEGVAEPFFSLILTISTHQPYNEHTDCNFNLTDDKLPERYRNYLINCHYTDAQIGKYLASLKQKGLYDNSLIIIASDHEPPMERMDMEGKFSTDLPLFIVNGGFSHDEVWNGECNQLDVYTTILNILGIDSKWRGLGYSLLNDDFQNSVSNKSKKLSEWIIRSDYFGKNF